MSKGPRKGFSDETVLSLLTENYSKKKIGNVYMYYLDSDETINIRYSRLHQEGGGMYWYGLSPNKIEIFKKERLAYICLIIGFEGLVKLPAAVLYKYIVNADISYKNDKIKHYHLRLKYYDDRLFLYNKAERFDLKDFYINIEEELVVDEINKFEFSKEDFLKIASEFVDFKEQYKSRTGTHKYRNESKAQKELIAKIEDHTCQICGFFCEYFHQGRKRWIIEVDHILEKSAGGGETVDNLIVLCPNCHAKKTGGLISIDKVSKKIYYREEEIRLVWDNHLGY